MEEYFVETLKKFNDERSKYNILPPTSSTTTKEIKNVIGEDPRDFLFNNEDACIVIADSYLSEGYECPSVIAFYGDSDSTDSPEKSENNFTNRSVANLIVFQKPEEESESEDD